MEWDDISLEIQGFKMSSTHEVDVNTTSNPIQRDGFGQAPNGSRVTVMETIGSPMGSTTIHNTSHHHRRMVSQRVGEGLVGNVDPMMEVHPVHRSQFVSILVAKTGPESSESLGLLEL